MMPRTSAAKPASAILAASVSAISEWPPRSKKLSLRPMFSDAENVGPQGGEPLFRLALRRLVGSRGEGVGSGLGQGLDVELAAGQARQAGRMTKAAGII